MMMWHKALEDCIAEVGVEELHIQLGVSRQTIYNWRRGKRKVKPELVIKVERVLGIPKSVIRPDLYGDAANGGGGV
jgi:transcriptional regulator with XRE-family HTH domain